MKTFLACCGVDGHADALTRIKEIALDRKPDAILFAGGVFRWPDPRESPVDAAERRQFEATFLAAFFSALGETDAHIAVVPGGHDGPLRTFLQVGMQEALHNSRLRLVHGMTMCRGDVVVSGVGGILTANEDSGEPLVRCSRVMAEYLLQNYVGRDEPLGVLLFSEAPTGRLGERLGNVIVGELIDSLHPRLCVVGGSSTDRGVDRVAHTTIVNPGRLCNGSYAWIDWGREHENQVELLNFY